MARLSMLIDLTRCIGCDACTLACKQENGTPADVFFARVLNVEAGTYPDVQRLYLPVLCNHCENPACLKACPNKAIYKREDGIVLIDQERCRGTGACVSACPYGNIILNEKDTWYLPEDRAYERDHVKPRLKENVARKCTFCAQRVDHGLNPACVVACPTHARIFGDLEDPQSEISEYIVHQEALTGREAFHLLPECGTEPANLYLGPMAQQAVSTLGATAEPGPVAEPYTGLATLKDAATKILTFLLIAFCLAPGTARAQDPDDQETWISSSCAGCHGNTAMGGMGPPLAQTKLDYAKFSNFVRHGKGMMPATALEDVPDDELQGIYAFAKNAPRDESQVPISFKIAGLLTTVNVGKAFAVIGIASLLLGLKVLLYWLDCAGLQRLWPYFGKLGWGRTLSTALHALIIEGLFVRSLWRKSKHRWAMHGLMLYGFLGLGATDFFMSVFNPTRADLSQSHPLKIAANTAGAILLLGLIYVRMRYRKDAYIDNGMTLGRDYSFVNLMTLALITGFLTELFGAVGANLWILPTYLVHLVLVATLLLSAPFTRFAHAFVVPALVAMTRLTEAVTTAGIGLGFEREPSPGRHHKSERIVAGLLREVAPDKADNFTIRYYP